MALGTVSFFKSMLEVHYIYFVAIAKGWLCQTVDDNPFKVLPSC